MAMDPGWYADPFGGGGYVRWWDGERWGPSTAAPVGAVVEPGRPVALPPPAPSPGAAPTYPAAPAAPGGAPAYAEAAAAGVELAAWGQRAAARVIDALIESVLQLPFVLVLIWPAMRDLIGAMPSGGGAVPQATVQAFVDQVTGLTLELTVVSVVVTFLYQVPQNVRWGQTLGKRVLGIRIRMKAADARPGWGPATVRWGTLTAFSLVSPVLVLIDYLWPLWDKPWRQALHDKTARTIVVLARRG